MAQYKVPQDVEAEDKLLGPFTFRQFVYLMIGGGCIAGAFGLFQLFMPLAIIPLPFGIFFIILALPLRKDQPMETYLAAVVSFYLKPNKRTWTAGQRESTILITAPKQKEDNRTRDITEEEASHRLSFLADIVDSEGYAIRGSASSSMREEYVAEANQVTDILEENNVYIDKMIAQEQAERKAELVNQMRTAMANADAVLTDPIQQTTQQNYQPSSNPNYMVPAEPAFATPTQNYQPISQPEYQQPIQPAYQPQPAYQQPVQQMPQMQPIQQPVYQQPVYQQPVQPAYQPVAQQLSQQQPTAEYQRQMANLANNNNYSIQTIASEANRIQQQQMQVQPPVPTYGGLKPPVFAPPKEDPLAPYEPMFKKPKPSTGSSYKASAIFSSKD